MGQQWRHRILIIDGDEHALSVIRNFLVNEGFDVTTACGTVAAISSLQSGGYDLVLVDDHFADLASSCFLKQLVRIPVKVPAIVMESAPSRPCRAAPYNPLRIVNQWRPCEILASLSEVLSARVETKPKERSV